MPHLQELWSELQTDRGDEVLVLCVNVSDSKQVIADYWGENGFTLRAIQQDVAEISEAFGVLAYPTNYVLGPDGRVVYRGVGFDEAAIRGALDATRRTSRNK